MDKTQSNFRVKVDLSKFFQDHRRISWIFVDTSTMFYVKHLIQHIAKLFDIKEPFFLLCDSTYLPFNENVRIIHNDNFITLVPGTLVDNSSNSIRELPSINFLKENTSLVSSAQASTYDEKEVQTDRDDQVRSLNSPNEDAIMKNLFDNTMPEPTTANTTMYHSILEEDEINDEINSATESKATESLVTEDCSLDINTPAKRRRVRRKKVKRLDDTKNKQNTSQEDQTKPRIIKNVVIASGKHIRFNPEQEIVSPVSYNSGNFDLQNTFYDTPCQKKSPSKDLKTLLTLKQCSTPLTFVCKKQTKIEKSSKSIIDEDVENLTESARNIVVPNETNEIKKSYDLIEDINPEEFPALKFIPKVEEVIAFKIFKMGADYSPQVSNYIIGRIIAVHAITTLCTIKVLRGQSEIEEPKGKYSLPDDETEFSSDVIKLNHSQLLEPRLIVSNE